LHLDVNVVRVPPFLLEIPLLLPKATLIEAFAVGQFLGEIRIHIATDLFDFDDGALQRFLLCKGELLQVAQEREEVICSLV
jgi:hypothetical protein